MRKFSAEGLKQFEGYRICSLEWNFLSGAYDILNWTLYFSLSKIRYDGALTDRIEGSGFYDLIETLTKLSSDRKDDFKFFIYVRNLKGFERVGENFLMWDGQCFVSDELKPFVLNANKLPKVEFRNWDFFFDEIEDGMDFLDALLKVYSEFRRGATFTKAFRFTLSKELWMSIKSGFELTPQEQKDLQKVLGCKTDDLLPRDRDEFDVLKRANHAGLLGINPDYVKTTVVGNLGSYDISSSHIGFMARKDYPLKQTGSYIKNAKLEVLDYLKEKDYAWIGIFLIRNIKPKTDLVIDLTKFGFIYNKKDERSSFVFTNVDWTWFPKLFDFEFIGIPYIFPYVQGKLPKLFRKNLGNLYKAKEECKKGSFERDIHKFMCEVPYGHSIKTPYHRYETLYIKEQNTFGKKAIIEHEVSFEQIKKKVKANGLPYQWGIWTVSYSVAELVSLLMDMEPQNALYWDTDGIKFKFDDEGLVQMAFDVRNEEIQSEKEDWLPEKLGQWKFEGNLTKFKAIGGKWYVFEKNGEYDCACAGANKDVILEWLGNDPMAFELFHEATNMGCDCFRTINYPSDKRTFYIYDSCSMNAELKHEFINFTEKITGKSRAYYRQHSWGTFLT